MCLSDVVVFRMFLNVSQHISKKLKLNFYEKNLILKTQYPYKSPQPEFTSSSLDFTVYNEL